jgi:hypothetical protein
VTGPDLEPGAIPPGTFRIDRDGAWLHEGLEVTHPGVLRNLYANLRVEGDVHYLQVGPRRVPVQVDDAPFVVVRASVSGAGDLEAHLGDGTVETLDPGTLTLDRHGVPHCRVKQGAFRARVSVAAWLQLAVHLEPDPGSPEPVLVVGGRRFRITREG